MRQQAHPQWKLVLAVFSLVLTVLIWQKGLQESFNRPSVSPKISINQNEIALLASPALPDSIRPILIGTNPDQALKEILGEIPQEKIEDREKLLLTLLDAPSDKSPSLDEISLKGTKFQVIKETLQKAFNQKTQQTSLEPLKLLKDDPLLYRVSCLSMGMNKEICFDNKISQFMAFKLIASQALPLLATFSGIVLCIRQCWIFLRKANLPWPEIGTLPISLVDIVLLVAGGFVVLGEVLTPLLVIPFTSILTSTINSPIKESFNVLIGYGAMAMPSLIIFRQQIKVVKGMDIPVSGWMQWGLRPISNAFSQAFRGWLMVMPFVLFISWLASLLIGDPGGSNPLLEMVLAGNNYWALGLLFITTVVLAPLFEEFIFRGVLLPVLVKNQGYPLGVLVSASIFALAHLSIGELPPLLVLGIGLALLRLSSGRLFPCVIMHSLWNGVTFLNLLLLGR